MAKELTEKEIRRILSEWSYTPTGNERVDKHIRKARREVKCVQLFLICVCISPIVMLLWEVLQ